MHWVQPGQAAPEAEDQGPKCTGWSMKDLSDVELIRLYIKATANESGDLPFGAEARRKAAGDELISRGITEIHLHAFTDPFPVRGSDVDARKCTTIFTRTGR